MWKPETATPTVSYKMLRSTFLCTARKVQYVDDGYGSLSLQKDDVMDIIFMFLTECALLLRVSSDPYCVKQ